MRSSFAANDSSLSFISASEVSVAFEDFEKRPDGSIKVCPLVGWDSYRPYGMMCGLRLHYADSEEKLIAQDFGAVPLIMTVAQARELAQVLTKLADSAEMPPKDEAAH